MEDFSTLLSRPKTVISLVVGAITVFILITNKIIQVKYFSSAKLKGEKMTVVHVLTGIFQALIVIAAVITVLQINGVNVTSALTGLGIAGAVAGLAVQDALKDAIMGIHIISDRFFSVGDVVKYKDTEGVVIDFNIRSTTIKDTDNGTVITICNRNISEITRMPKSTVTNLDLPISYEEDYKHVNRTFEDICKKIQQFDGIDNCLYKGVQDFGTSAVIYRLQFSCLPEKRFELRRACLKTAQKELTDANIKIPYDLLVVHND